MEIPGAGFIKGLFGKKESPAAAPNSGTEIAPGNVVGDGMKRYGQSPDKQATPLVTPKTPDMMAINQNNAGVAKPNPDAVEGMYNAAAAGKPIAAEIFAADSGAPLPDNLQKVAEDQKAGLKVSPSPASATLGKTA